MQTRRLIIKLRKLLNHDLTHCPISKAVMRHPVLASDSWHYELRELLNYLKNDNYRFLSPVTQERITSANYDRFLKDTLDVVYGNQEREAEYEGDYKVLLEELTSLIQNHHPQLQIASFERLPPPQPEFIRIERFEHEPVEFRQVIRADLNFIHNAIARLLADHPRDLADHIEEAWRRLVVAYDLRQFNHLINRLPADLRADVREIVEFGFDTYRNPANLLAFLTANVFGNVISTLNMLRLLCNLNAQIRHPGISAFLTAAMVFIVLGNILPLIMSPERSLIISAIAALYIGGVLDYCFRLDNNNEHGIFTSFINTGIAFFQPGPQMQQRQPAFQLRR